MQHALSRLNGLKLPLDGNDSRVAELKGWNQVYFLHCMCVLPNGVTTLSCSWSYREVHIRASSVEWSLCGCQSEGLVLQPQASACSRLQADECAAV